MNQATKEWLYEQWLAEVEKEHPGVEIEPTHWGCAGRDESGGIVFELDYDPDPDAEARVRY